MGKIQMKNFKKFFEAQSKGVSDILNVLYGNIKLDDANSEVIMPDAGIRSTFRHITNCSSSFDRVSTTDFGIRDYSIDLVWSTVLPKWFLLEGGA